MELKRLIRGADEALVEPGSQAETELRAIGFTEQRGRADGPGSHKPGDGGATPPPATTVKVAGLKAKRDELLKKLARDLRAGPAAEYLAPATTVKPEPKPKKPVKRKARR